MTPVRNFAKHCLSAFVLCVSLVSAAPAADGSGTTNQSGSDGSSGGTASRTAGRPPDIALKCVFVRDHELWEDVRQLWTGSADAPTKRLGGKAPDENGPSTAPTACPATIDGKQITAAGDLIGAGDLEVVVAQEQYNAAAEYEADPLGKALVLYINGVPLAKDAELQAIEHREGNTHLRYRIKPGADTQTLWAMLYRAQWLTHPEPLRVALGWSGAGPTSGHIRLSGSPTLAITDGFKASLGGVFLVALLVLCYTIGRTSDVLRDAALPAWWKEAQTLHLAHVASAPADRDDALKKRFETSYDPANATQYAEAAAKALNGIEVPLGERNDATIGLVLRKDRWSPARAAFSLGRVQMFVWFAFAVAAGIFLWIVYGHLPALDGSLLALLGLSVATTGVSLAADRNAGGRDYTPSQGFFTDIVTGFDDKQQVHRYQAVVVNLLLLFVGIFHVLQQLTYPIFEPTWLALLGLSGAALGLGKQILEQPGANPRPPTVSPSTASREPGSAGQGHGGGSTGQRGNADAAGRGALG